MIILTTSITNSFFHKLSIKIACVIISFQAYFKSYLRNVTVTL